MPEYKTVITRSEVVTIAQSHKNDYGDLVFTDTQEKEHKITKKRERLYPIIVNGRAVKLDYATYMNKEYIAEATLFDGQVPQQSPPKPVESPKKPTESHIARETTQMNDNILKQRSMCLSYAKDLVCAGKIELSDMERMASIMLNWLNKA